MNHLDYDEIHALKKLFDFKLHNIEEIKKTTFKNINLFSFSDFFLLSTDLTKSTGDGYIWDNLSPSYQKLNIIKYNIGELLKKASNNLFHFITNLNEHCINLFIKAIIEMPILRHIELINEREMIRLKKINPIIDIFEKSITNQNGLTNLDLYKNALNNIKPINIYEYTKLFGYAYHNYDYPLDIDDDGKPNKDRLDCIKLCEKTILNFKIGYTKDKELLHFANKNFKQKYNFIPTQSLIMAELPKIVLYHELGHVLLGARDDNPNEERFAQMMASVFCRNTLDSMLIEYISNFQPEAYRNAALWGLYMYD